MMLRGLVLCGLGGEGRCCLFELRREEQDAAISEALEAEGSASAEAWSW